MRILGLQSHSSNSNHFSLIFSLKIIMHSENSRNGLNGSTNISRSNDGDESNRNAHSSNSFYKEGGSAKQPSRSKSFEDEDSKSGRSGNGESWGGNRSLNNVVSIRKCTNDEYHRDGVCFNNDGTFVESEVFFKFEDVVVSLLTLLLLIKMCHF